MARKPVIIQIERKPGHGTDKDYIVKKTHNTINPKVGTFLSEDQIEKLIRDPDIERVEII